MPNSKTLDGLERCECAQVGSIGSVRRGRKPTSVRSGEGYERKVLVMKMVGAEESQKMRMQKGPRKRIHRRRLVQHIPFAFLVVVSCFRDLIPIRHEIHWLYDTSRMSQYSGALRCSSSVAIIAAMKRKSKRESRAPMLRPFGMPTQPQIGAHVLI